MGCVCGSEKDVVSSHITNNLIDNLIFNEEKIRNDIIDEEEKYKIKEIYI